MWTEDDIKRLKQQEQDMLRQVGKAPRDEAKAIKAAKAAEKTPAKMNHKMLPMVRMTPPLLAVVETPARC